MDALEAGICSRPIGYSPRTLFMLAVLLRCRRNATKTDAVHYPFTGPVFGLAIAPDGSLLVTDAGADLRNQEGWIFAGRSVAGRDRGLADRTRRHVRDHEPRFRRRGSSIACLADRRAKSPDLAAFELRVNPDGNPVAPPPAAGPSNPFDVEALSGGHVLVADAAGNSLLIVDQKGDVDWIATLPNEVVSTANAKAIFGCPGSNAPQCNLPAQIPAQPVATSVAVGPDGAYYVGELKGFPAPKSESRIGESSLVPVTRCAARVRRAGSSRTDSPQSSIWSSVRMAHSMSSNWTRRAGWPCRTGRERVARSSACNSSGWVCTQIATGKPMLSAVAVGGDGTKFIVTNALIPATVDISALP